MNRQDADLVPLGQMSEGGGRFGLSVAGRMRWAGIRSAHPKLFDGLAPTISLNELPPSNRPELRLVIGPLASANAAVKLCATLGRFRLTCQPTIFARRHLTLD
jgi:hypothetical protein